MRRLLATCVWVTLLAACTKNAGDGGTIPVLNPSITLSASSSSGTVVRGASTTTALTLARVDYTGAVSLTADGLPSGVTVAFAPPSLATGVTSSTATITVDQTAAPGTSTINLRASGSGVSEKVVQFALTIPTPAITLTAGSSAVTAVQGTSVTVPVTISRTNGASGAITLATTGLPTGATASFAPSPIGATETSSTLTLVVGSAVATGTTAITISASGTGVTTQTATVQLTVTAAAIPAFTLVAAPAALSVVAGQSGTSTVTITRTGGFVGAVTLTVEGAPVGVTATAAAPGTGTTSIVTLATAANTAAGTYNLTVRGTATGLTDRTSTIALTVTTAPGFILAASAASAQAGSSGASTVTITRVGGLTANVDLVASGLPANVSASFDPASASGTSSTLTFAAAGNATPGSYTVTVSGTATGASAQSTTVALTITAAPGGGNIVAWKFCDATRVPLWFAYRTGTTGTWTRVTGSADNTFSFTLSGTVGGVAFVQNQSGGGTQGTVYYYTAAELNNIALGECINSAGGNKSLNAIFTGLNGAQFQSGTVYVGGGSGTTGFTTTTATVSNVPNRVADLIAYRSTVNITTASLSVDRAVLRRNVNYAANSGIPSIDFDGAESFAIGVAALSFTNAGADLTSVSGSFSTSNGFVGAIAALAGNQVYGVPSSRTQAGDFHLINAIAVSTDNTSFRITSQYNRDIANRAITFGAALANATLSVTGTSPYARIKAVGAFTSEYNDVVSCSMSQGSAASSRAWSFNGSRAYFGTGNTAFEFELPDFSGVSGFLNTWGFTAGAQAQVTTNVLGGITGTLGTPAEGSAWRSGARLQTITP